jgi:cytochrome P450
MPDNSSNLDPFKQARQEKGVLPARMDGSVIPMLLRYRDVKDAAKDYQTFSSDAPFRVPIPSEEELRSVRQLPIETNPPEHTEYRKIVEPFFHRPRDPEFAARIEALIDELLTAALERDSFDVVEDFALPLQSRALTYLLNVPENEADEWIRWGTHVFHAGADGISSADALTAYIHRKLDETEARPGDDFFSALNQATFRGKPLTRDEMEGFANLTFAGGRDTVINSVAFVIAHLGEHGGALEQLRADPRIIKTAAEEFVRVLSPLTHIGRVCPVDTDVHGEKVPAGERVSLCWASANYDETVFEEPEEVRLDRKPNPHVGFGFGTHNCLGALHSRLILRALMERLVERVSAIEILEIEENFEEREDYRRKVGYHTLKAKFGPR